VLPLRNTCRRLRGSSFSTPEEFFIRQEEEKSYRDAKALRHFQSKSALSLKLFSPSGQNGASSRVP